MKINNINFTSKLVFIPEKTFDSIDVGDHIDLQFPNEKAIYDNKKNILITGVRTCSAGTILNTTTGDYAAFHIYDCEDSLKAANSLIEEIFEKIPGADKAILVGGKRLQSRIHSMELLKKIKYAIQKKIKNITTFERHKFSNSETNMFYSVQDDTWLINSLYSPYSMPKCNDVKSVQELLKSYGKIKIAKDDIVCIQDKPIFGKDITKKPSVTA